MSIVVGVIACIFGALSFVASCIRAHMGDRQKSHENEMGAIGWFILAALCLR